MTAYFVDSSALAKRYIIEKGSGWVRSWILGPAGHDIVISALSTVEIVSLMVRREREGAITFKVRTTAQNNFLRHVTSQYHVIELNNNVLTAARTLLEKYPMRSLDAIQLASALEVVKSLQSQPTFVSADTRLLTVASSEGFNIDDPNLHP